MILVLGDKFGIVLWGFKLGEKLSISFLSVVIVIIVGLFLCFCNFFVIVGNVR